MTKNMCSIYLDCKLSSTLNFQEEKKRAEEAILKGMKLCFEIDFGITGLVYKPSQILSFQLGLKHVEETFIKDFETHIEGIFLYKGNLDFAKGKKRGEYEEDKFLKWLQSKNLDAPQSKQLSILFTLFCRDQLISLLKEITLDFSQISFSLLLDASTIDDPFLFSFLTEKKYLSPFQIVLIGGPQQETTAPFAICLPAFEDLFKSHDKSFENLFHFFTEKKIPYRTISESSLLTEWYLVDFLFAASDYITQNGKRMLQGFLAAGGTIVTIGNLFEFDGEISFPEFAIQYIK